MSRGIFGIAESVLRLRPALEEVLAEREAAELARERAIEETKTVLAYQQALQEHVVELEARLGELREAIPPEERKVRTALEALERQAVELRGEVSMLQNQAQQLRWDIRDLKEEQRALVDQAIELRKQVPA
jgi:chromosome segregation ATPase